MVEKELKTGKRASITKKNDTPIKKKVANNKQEKKSVKMKTNSSKKKTIKKATDKTKSDKQSNTAKNKVVLATTQDSEMPAPTAPAASEKDDITNLPKQNPVIVANAGSGISFWPILSVLVGVAVIAGALYTGYTTATKDLEVTDQSAESATTQTRKPVENSMLTANSSNTSQTQIIEPLPTNQTNTAQVTSPDTVTGEAVVTKDESAGFFSTAISKVKGTFSTAWDKVRKPSQTVDGSPANLNSEVVSAGNEAANVINPPVHSGEPIISKTASEPQVAIENRQISDNIDNDDENPSFFSTFFGKIKRTLAIESETATDQPTAVTSISNNPDSAIVESVSASPSITQVSANSAEKVISSATDGQQVISSSDPLSPDSESKADNPSLFSTVVDKVKNTLGIDNSQQKQQGKTTAANVGAEATSVAINTNGNSLTQPNQAPNVQINPALAVTPQQSGFTATQAPQTRVVPTWPMYPVNGPTPPPPGWRYVYAPNPRYYGPYPYNPNYQQRPVQQQGINSQQVN